MHRDSSVGYVFYLMENASTYLRRAERAGSEGEEQFNMRQYENLCRRIHELSGLTASHFIGERQ